MFGNVYLGWDFHAWASENGVDLLGRHINQEENKNVDVLNKNSEKDLDKIAESNDQTIKTNAVDTIVDTTVIGKETNQDDLFDFE